MPGVGRCFADRATRRENRISQEDTVMDENGSVGGASSKLIVPSMKKPCVWVPTTFSPAIVATAQKDNPLEDKDNRHQRRLQTRWHSDLDHTITLSHHLPCLIICHKFQLGPSAPPSPPRPPWSFNLHSHGHHQHQSQSTTPLTNNPQAGASSQRCSDPAPSPYTTPPPPPPRWSRLSSPSTPTPPSSSSSSPSTSSSP